ncbi:MAG: polyprenol monophosphomannose synthase [Endomicrobiales bacterium]|jgi:dolichol-phosphate mannosyltransferase|nr:polyprenol monophosphomannose synthase [Endomicrobiales bacterium]
MKTIVMIPTYNEAGNIEGLVKEILALPLELSVLVVDDFSPDKTYEIVKQMSDNDPRVMLLLRKENRGRGWAGIDGFKKALELGADYIVEMDGDFSHSPKYIPNFIAAAINADVVIGSRYVAGGKDDERTFLRKAISFFARKYIATVLGVKVQDSTSGFRLFSHSALEKIIVDLCARDPFIVSEVLYSAHKNKLKIVEVPIEFMPRAKGVSKLQASTLIKYLLRVLCLRFKCS